MTGRDAAVVLALLCAVFGLGVLLSVRFGRGGGPLRLAGVGRLSRVTHALIGLSGLAAGHQLAAHALGWGMRAPWALTVSAIALAVLGSVALDALDARQGVGGESNGEGPGE